MAKKSPPKVKKATPKTKKLPAPVQHEEADPHEPPSERVDQSLGENDPSYIVALGASAGGLDALTEVLRALPPATGMSFVILQHLDPKHVSLLREILTRETPMPILEIQSGMRAAPNTVYVVARDSSLQIQRGALFLEPRVPSVGRQLIIDKFFRSLAEDQGSRSVGVILSGNASDGTLGMKAIKAAGGITFAQEPKTARNEEMPSSAIAYGFVDKVLPPIEIAAELAQLAAFRRPEVAAEDPSPGTSEGIARIINLLRTARGVDFSHYKSNTIRRRILRRMVLRKVDHLDQYVTLLRSDPAEVDGLYDDLLINVTEFFRDPEVFDALRTRVLPKICNEQRLSKKKHVRIWVPGCSTGEEAYSLAITLLEFFGDRANELDIQLFATDISDAALERARVGIYAHTIQPAVSAERLRRFFLKVENGYQIQKRVREMCVFAKHNVIKDPPFSKLDLISCRNLLIYLGTNLQQKIIPTFHYALNPVGFLLLGSSETIGTAGDLFALVDKKNKIYERKSAARRAPVEFAAAEKAIDVELKANTRAEHWDEADLQREADRLVLSRYGPPGIIVDEDLNILQFRGHTGPFLEPAAGTASLNLQKMARDGVLVELKNALTRARQEGTTIRRMGLRLRQGDGFLRFNMEVAPLRKGSSRLRHYLVLFEPAAKEADVEVAKSRAPLKRGKAKPPEDDSEHLRKELAATKEYLQSIVEDQEAAHEELRSAAEEIQSSNEELQSTNEELETAKEELQSTNEELNTVNEELQNRNTQLMQLSNDLTNLLSNVSMPIVILGNDLRIKRFTPVAEKILHLLPTDVGRPLSDISLYSRIPELQQRLTQVMENLAPQSIEADDADGRHFSIRIRPYRTEDNRIEGVVIVFVDFETRAQAEAHGSAPETVKDTQMRQFAARLLQAQEDERRRVARELHDDLNQKLVLLEFVVQSAGNDADASENIKKRMDLLRKNVAELTEDVRQIAYGLHPSILDHLGLIAALRAYCNDFAKRESFLVKFTAKNVPEPVTQDVALVLYRIVQEGLRNALKHSGARVVSVLLRTHRGNLELQIKDPGIGFNVDETRLHSGLGLVGMEERARLIGGAVEVLSEPGAGTEILVRVPLEKSIPEDLPERD